MFFSKGIVPEFAKDVLNTLPSHVVVLDEQGVIVLFNEAWKTFAEKNHYPDPQAGLGTNYLAVCKTAKGPSSGDMEKVIAGIEGVLQGKIPSFYFEYPCHSQDEKRWFLMRVQRISRDGKNWVLISHDNITERKLSELDRDETIIELRKAMDEIKILKNMVPICSWCKKVRDDKGFWDSVEEFIHKNSSFEVTHGICPECYKKMQKDIPPGAEGK